MTSRIVLLILIVLFIGSCTPLPGERNVTTATAPFATATLPLPAPPTLPSSQTALPAPPQPTAAPVEGTASTQINVRSEPSTASNVLGIIAANTKVQILAKDPAGNWLQILYPQGVGGKGWVTAKYIVTASGTEVPVIGGDATNPNNGNVAIVQQQINIRSGPGTSFNSLGTLNPQDVVHLIGKAANGAWLQIEFSSGPEGKGWVNAAFVQAKGVENIPIITDGGEVVGTGTPTSIPSTPTATVLPAWMDNDSQNNPIASIVFELLGTHTFIYSGDVSAPNGDSQDWIRFIPDGDTVSASLKCTGNEALQVRLFESGQPATEQIVCNEVMKQLKVKGGATYIVHVQAPQSSGGVQYFRYTITITAGL